jgi:NitT/TauT family transport system permease protein
MCAALSGQAESGFPQGAASGGDVDEEVARDRARVRRRERVRERSVVTGLQVVIAVAFLCAWQWLPEIHAVSSAGHAFNVFFISSPSRIVSEIGDLATGRNGTVDMWKPLGATVGESLLGAVIGITLGAVCGLLLSNSRRLGLIFQPFIVALNAVPLVAVIPILVIISGVGFRTSVILSVVVVFFLVFFNAFEGGRSVAPQLLQNAAILGASSWQVMWQIRRPYVVAWTFTSLPLAITFSLLTVVTTEILTGQSGMGQLISQSTDLANATLTFAVVVVLSIAAMVIVGLSSLLRNRLVPWREEMV